METKNIIIQNYAQNIIDASNSCAIVSRKLNDNEQENNATIKTLNVLIESIRSQIVLLQGEIDIY
jgi:hypothetical protein